MIVKNSSGFLQFIQTHLKIPHLKCGSKDRAAHFIQDANSQWQCLVYYNPEESAIDLFPSPIKANPQQKQAVQRLEYYYLYMRNNTCLLGFCNQEGEYKQTKIPTDSDLVKNFIKNQGRADVNTIELIEKFITPLGGQIQKPYTLPVNAIKNKDVLAFLKKNQSGPVTGEENCRLLKNFIHATLILRTNLKYLFSDPADVGISFAYSNLARDGRVQVEFFNNLSLISLNELGIYYESFYTLKCNQAGLNLWQAIESAVKTWIDPVFTYTQQYINEMKSFTAREDFRQNLQSAIVGVIKFEESSKKIDDVKKSFLSALPEISSAETQRLSTAAIEHMTVAIENLTAALVTTSVDDFFSDKTFYRYLKLALKADQSSKDISTVTTNKSCMFSGRRRTGSFNPSNYKKISLKTQHENSHTELKKAKTDMINTYLVNSPKVNQMKIFNNDNKLKNYSKELFTDHIDLLSAIILMSDKTHTMKGDFSYIDTCINNFCERIKNISEKTGVDVLVDTPSEVSVIQKQNKRIIRQIRKDLNGTKEHPLKDLCKKAGKVRQKNLKTDTLYKIYYLALQVASKLSVDQAFPEPLAKVIEAINKFPDSKKMQNACLFVLSMHHCLPEDHTLKLFYVNQEHINNVFNKAGFDESGQLIPRCQKNISTLLNSIIMRLSDTVITFSQVNGAIEALTRYNAPSAVENTTTISLVDFIKKCWLQRGKGQCLFSRSITEFDQAIEQLYK